MRLFGEVLDMPLTLGTEKERLSNHSCFASQSRRRNRAGMPLQAPTALEVEEEAGQFDMSIPKAVDYANSLVFQDRTCLRRGLTCNEQERNVGARARVRSELPRRCGIGTLLELDGNGGAVPCETQDCVDATICSARLWDYG
jgi:hypothetical protein